MAGGDMAMLRSARQILRSTRRMLRSTPQNVVIAADFTGRGETAYRLAGEVRHLAQSRSTVSLVQTRRPGERDRIAAEILTCLRRNLARRMLPDDALDCETLILHRPSIADDLTDLLSRITCEELVVVCHTSADVAAARNLDPRRGHTSIFVASPFSSEPLAQVNGDAGYWMPVVDSHPARVDLPSARRTTALCWLMPDEHETSAARDVRALMSSDGVEHHATGGTAPGSFPLVDNLSLDRVLFGIDIFVIPPERSLSDLPDTIIAAALHAGKPVILPTSLKTHYGAGPIYYEDKNLRQTLDTAIAAVRAGGSGRGGREPAEFVLRCKSGPITRLRNRKRPRMQHIPSRDGRPVMFLPSNGVGVGHLTRLLAIARRIGRKAVFASQAPALQVIRDFGFAAEYIPSHAAVGGDFDSWDAWFTAEVGRLADTYDPALVVYDGNHLSPGLIHAVASRQDCRLAWVRRGMWARTTSRFLANARWCDLVIEPGELAGERDDGATSLLRHEVRNVDPIRLLEADELPDRRAAARALNLDPDRPACLVQLGSGSNRDLLSLLDRIINDLRRHPTLQIAVAEWVSGSVPLNLWPEVTVLRGFPISQYVRAFDFCISASGYNSFHEMIGCSVPTIFLADRNPRMDDQYGRAKFAQDNAAAFEISETEMGEFPDLVAMMMQRKAREFLAAHCAKLARPNGATAAADALGVLADAAGDRH